MTVSVFLREGSKLQFPSLHSFTRPVQTAQPVLGAGTHGRSKMGLVLICIFCIWLVWLWFVFLDISFFFFRVFSPTNVLPERFRKEGKKGTFIEHLACARPCMGHRDSTAEQNE